LGGRKGVRAEKIFQLFQKFSRLFSRAKAKRAQSYFKSRDEKALDYLPKLLTN
jgi:hypothetical protein